MVDLTAEALAAEIGIPDDEISRAQRLLDAATAVIERYAPGAPVSPQERGRDKVLRVSNRE